MFSSKDKKNSNNHQHMFAPKNNQHTSGTALTVRNSSPTCVEQFYNFKDQIAKGLLSLEDQIKILKSYYLEFAQNPLLTPTARNQIKANISQQLDNIYKKGNEISNIFLQANPVTLFKNSKLPVDDITQYQLIYDNLHAWFKTTWIDLYDAKDKHVKRELKMSKQFLAISYPKASQELITAAATLMMDDNTLTEQVLLMNATDFLRHAQQRHNEVIKLEKSLYEVNQLFIDMMVLTNNQGETVDHILQNVQSAKQKVKESITELSDAKDLKKHSFRFS